MAAPQVAPSARSSKARGTGDGHPRVGRDGGRGGGGTVGEFRVDYCSSSIGKIMVIMFSVQDPVTPAAVLTASKSLRESAATPVSALPKGIDR